MEKINKTCCFTGHRRIDDKDKEAIKAKLKTAIILLIENGVLYFGAGGALGFDTLAAMTVLELKKDYPDIKLILVLPCKNQTLYWSNKKDIEIYNYIKERADKIVYTSEFYESGCMFKRNRHLVDNSKYCICYFNFNNRTNGGTAYTVNYAEKQGRVIINLAYI